MKVSLMRKLWKQQVEVPCLKWSIRRLLKKAYKKVGLK
jgi:hypothetical protein